MAAVREFAPAVWTARMSNDCTDGWESYAENIKEHLETTNPLWLIKGMVMVQGGHEIGIVGWK